MQERSDQFERGQSIALNYLSSCARTVQQVRDRLAKGEIDEPVIEAVVEWLLSYGYLDDAGFARAWVASRGDRKRLSQRGLRVELTRKGLPRELIEEVMAEEEPEAEEARAHRLAEEWVAKLRRRGTDPAVLARKAAAAVQRRGFSSSVAWAAVRAATPSDADTESRPFPEEHDN